ncbi:MAG: hypothetical protein ABT940_00470 [Alphaproteobacteria bacterium]
MTDHATRAREIVDKINSQRNRIAGGYEIPRDEPGPVALIAAALTRAAEEAHEAHVWEVSPAMAQAKIDQLNAQLQAAQPVWSKDKPTVAGFYFWRVGPRDEDIEICCVHDDLQSVLFFEGEWAMVNVECGEWAKIPLPREA